MCFCANPDCRWDQPPWLIRCWPVNSPSDPIDVPFHATLDMTIERARTIACDQRYRSVEVLSFPTRIRFAQFNILWQAPLNA